MEQHYEAIITNPVLGVMDLREFIVPFAAGTLTRIDLETDNPNAAGAAIFDVLKNGATVFPGGAGRPQIAASGSSGNASGLAVAVARGDNILIAAATVPAGGIGGKLYIVITFDDGASLALGGDVTGDNDANTVVKIRNRDVVALPPALGMSDNFDDNAINPDIWGAVVKTNVNAGAPLVAETGGRLEFQPAGSGVEYIMPSIVQGDWREKTLIFYMGGGFNGAAGTKYAVHIVDGTTLNSFGATFGQADVMFGTKNTTGNPTFSGISSTLAGAAQMFSGWPFWVKFAVVGTNCLFSTAPDVAGAPGAWTLRATCALLFVPSNAYLTLLVRQAAGAPVMFIDSLSSDMGGADSVLNHDMLLFDTPNNRFSTLFDLMGIPGDGQTFYYNLATGRFEWRTLSPTIISGAVEEDIAWSNLTANTSIGALNKLLTTADWNSVLHQGAQAAQAIQAVGGYVKFRVQGAAANRTRYIGLRTTPPTNHNSASFDPYYIQVRDDGFIHIVENDALLLGTTAYADNDLLEYRAEGTTAAPLLKVYKNGVFVVTFATAPAFPLYLDVALPFNATEIREGKIKRTA